MKKRILASAGVIGGMALLLSTKIAVSQPPAPITFCDTYPESPFCSAGPPACDLCHTAPPTLNLFGADVSANLLVGTDRPLSESQFEGGLADALSAVENLDSDGDGFNNLEELLAGSSPADESAIPEAGTCPDPADNSAYAVCNFDARFTFRRMYLDVCGQSPTYEQVEAIVALDGVEAQRSAIDAELESCFDSSHWLAKDGQLWKLAHDKIRPLQAIKAGDEGGPLPLSDYFDDYNFYAYVMSDGRDARDLLLGDYYVLRSGTDYTPTDNKFYQNLDDTNRRAGMLTMNWFLINNIMFTALPRTAAAQAYRSYLGTDIAKMQGLYPVQSEPVDYDVKGVAAPECAVCHSTLDPLTYPFATYNGLDGNPLTWGGYDTGRLQRHFSNEGGTLYDTPEQGALFGEPVDDLVEWATVAANSDAFAITMVNDFWKLLMGEEPRAEFRAEFDAVVESFKTEHNYSIEAMIKDIVNTEAYSAP